MNFIKLLKKIPIDLGQTAVTHKTKGKKIALELAGKVQEKKALNVGCGIGLESEKLKRRGYDVISIDKVKVYKNCQIVDVNGVLPFNDDSFDLVFSTEVIEHLDSPLEAVMEFYRVLKKGGKLIITTPNSYFFLMNFFYLFGYSPSKLQIPGHKHFFNYQDIKKIFPSAKIYGYFPYYLLKFRISRLISFLSPTFIIKGIK